MSASFKVYAGATTFVVVCLVTVATQAQDPSQTDQSPAANARPRVAIHFAHERIGELVAKKLAETRQPSADRSFAPVQRVLTEAFAQSCFEVIPFEHVRQQLLFLSLKERYLSDQEVRLLGQSLNAAILVSVIRETKLDYQRQTDGSIVYTPYVSYSAHTKRVPAFDSTGEPARESVSAKIGKRLPEAELAQAVRAAAEKLLGVEAGQPCPVHVPHKPQVLVPQAAPSQPQAAPAQPQAAPTQPQAAPAQPAAPQQPASNPTPTSAAPPTQDSPNHAAEPTQPPATSVDAPAMLPPDGDYLHAGLTIAPADVTYVGPAVGIVMGGTDYPIAFFFQARLDLLLFERESFTGNGLVELSMAATGGGGVRLFVNDRLSLEPNLGLRAFNIINTADDDPRTGEGVSASIGIETGLQAVYRLGRKIGLFAAAGGMIDFGGNDSSLFVRFGVTIH